MFRFRKNRDRCPDTVPDDIMKTPCPAEISIGTRRAVLPVLTRRQRRRDRQEDVAELAGPYLVPADPADSELRAELEGGTLADDLRFVYRLRPWWTAGGIVDRFRALGWLASVADRLDVDDAPGAPAR